MSLISFFVDIFWNLWSCGSSLLMHYTKDLSIYPHCCCLVKSPQIRAYGGHDSCQLERALTKNSLKHIAPWDTPHPRSIEWFIENQAFFWSYDSAPHPPLPPHLTAASCLSYSVFVYNDGRAYWRERGEGVGRHGAYNHATARRHGPL